MSSAWSSEEEKIQKDRSSVREQNSQISVPSSPRDREGAMKDYAGGSLVGNVSLLMYGLSSIGSFADFLTRRSSQDLFEQLSRYTDSSTLLSTTGKSSGRDDTSSKSNPWNTSSYSGGSFQPRQDSEDHLGARKPQRDWQYSSGGKGAAVVSAMEYNPDSMFVPNKSRDSRIMPPFNGGLLSAGEQNGGGPFFPSSQSPLGGRMQNGFPGSQKSVVDLIQQDEYNGEKGSRSPFFGDPAQDGGYGGSSSEMLQGRGSSGYDFTNRERHHSSFHQRQEMLDDDPMHRHLFETQGIEEGLIDQMGMDPYGSGPGSGFYSQGDASQYTGQPSPRQHTLANHHMVQGDQYVSVLPVQRGQQVAYWPVEPEGMTPVFIDGTLAMMSRVPDEGIHSQYNSTGRYPSRAPTDKAGRGRRNPQMRRDNRKMNGLASPLLEEFRLSAKSREWTMHQIRGHILEFCQDQNGSRFIQQRLEMGDPGEQQVAMDEVLPSIRRLRNDVFGNYVVQKLLDFGSPAIKLDIRKSLEGEMLQLSLQMYGCRVVQKALEAVSEDDLPQMLLEFHHNVLSCIHDQNGNHVIQKCIEMINTRAKKHDISGDVDRASFLREQIDFIVNDVLENTVSLSCHPYGCRVLQRILEHCTEEKRGVVLDEIQKCHRKLLDDQYGNYVIQHVLQFGRTSDRDSILRIIVDTGLLGLSRQKFASNVVEKLLKHGNGTHRKAIAREMLKVRYSQILILPCLELIDIVFFVFPHSLRQTRRVSLSMWEMVGRVL